MQLATAFATVLLATAVAADWSLKITTRSGQTVTTHGTLGHGCTNYDSQFDLSSPVVKAEYHDNTFTDTFEIFAGKNCKGRMYRNSEGTYNIIPPYTVKSYHVY
jgi:hypothetical protein